MDQEMTKLKRVTLSNSNELVDLIGLCLRSLRVVVFEGIS